MGYDLFNEPENGLKVQKLKYNKYDFTKLVSDWSLAVRRNDPNHLITIGLFAPDFTGFDPATMPIDFVSFHWYAQNDNVNITIDKMKAWYYWCSKTITIPWIIGETGYSASNDPMVNSSPVVGTEADQKTFVDQTLQKSLDCNCKAYSYWHFQEYAWGDPYEDHLGLFYKFGEGATNWYGLGGYPYDPNAYKLDTLAMTPKLAVSSSSFGNYASMVKGSCGMPTNYYSVLNGPLAVTVNVLHGFVRDNYGTPIPNACIVGSEGWNDGSAYTTFADANGEFWLRSGGDNGNEAMTDITISYPGYSQLYYSNRSAPWMPFPTGNNFVLQKVNYKAWTKEYQNTDGKLYSGTVGRDWGLWSSTKFYKGDFNGDGVQDLLCIEPAPGEYLACGSGGPMMYVLTYKNPLTTNPYSSGWQILADNCDGSDLYNYRYGKLTVGDFNGDGKDDILAMNGNMLTYFIFSGGTWTAIDSNNGLINDPNNSMSWIAGYSNYLIAGDFDGSGRDGVIGVAPGTNPWITWFKRDNSGNWIWLQSNNGLTNNSNYKLSYLTPYAEQLIVGDFDGDSKDDILGNKLTAGGLQLFKYNPYNGTWWMPGYWKDVTNNSGMWAYRQNLLVGNFDMDASDEILGINSSFCVKFDYNGSSFYWDSSYEPLISDWNISSSADKYLFIKTDKNLPQQLFVHKGTSVALYSWNMNGWQCATLRMMNGNQTQSPTPVKDPSVTNNLFLFPNPAKGELNIRIEASDDLTDPSFKVTDVVGQVVLNNKLETIKKGSFETKTDLEGLKPGIYFITLFNKEQKIVTKRVILQ